MASTTNLSSTLKYLGDFFGYHGIDNDKELCMAPLTHVVMVMYKGMLCEEFIPIFEGKSTRINLKIRMSKGIPLHKANMNSSLKR